MNQLMTLSCKPINVLVLVSYGFTATLVSLVVAYHAYCYYLDTQIGHANVVPVATSSKD